MKRFYLIITLLLCLCAISTQAQTQPKPTTSGAVWEIIQFKTKPGKYDDYINFLRKYAKPTLDEEKQQGLIIDYKFYTKPTNSSEPNDWDIELTISYRNYAYALDDDEEILKKYDEIELKHYGTGEAKRKYIEQRAQLRVELSDQFIRELTLNPIK